MSQSIRVAAMVFPRTSFLAVPCAATRNVPPMAAKRKGGRSGAGLARHAENATIHGSNATNAIHRERSRRRRLNDLFQLADKTSLVDLGRGDFAQSTGCVAKPRV